MSDAPDLKLHGAATDAVPPPPVDPVATTLGMEARTMVKAIALPAEGSIPPDLQRQLCSMVRAHLKRYGVTLRELGAQVSFSSSVLSEVLAGGYKADPTPILRLLNGWIEDDERRRQRSKPIGFYATSVFESIRALARYAKSQARLPNSGGTVAEHEPPRIAFGFGESGIGKTLGAQALHSEDGLSIYVRVREQAGTASALARLIIESAGMRRKQTDRNSVNYVIDRLTDSARLLIVDEAHRLKRSGLEFIRDMVDVAGIPVLMLGTQEMYDDLAKVRARAGNFGYAQFGRRVGYVLDLVRGVDGQGGVKRPIFSMAEVRTIFRSDTVKLAPDAAALLQDIACTIGLGMLGMATNCYEKCHRAAARREGIITAKLVIDALTKTLFPAGLVDKEVLNRVHATSEFNRSLAAG